MTRIYPDDTTSGGKVNSPVACLDHTRQRPDLFRGAQQSIEMIEPFDGHSVAMIGKCTLYFRGRNVNYPGKAVQPHISVRIARDTGDAFCRFRIRRVNAIEEGILQQFDTLIASNPDSSSPFID